MEEWKRSRLIRKPQLEDVPELIHLIQSYLMPKEAARTCILSKSWLHAWSTIPTLRFPDKRAAMMADRTLQRYLRDNIPFETIDLVIDIKNQVSDSLVEKWIRPVATSTCVKDLSLKFDMYVKAPYTLPGEIFSSETIRKISIDGTFTRYNVFIGSNPTINCVSLRVLKLEHVNICEEVLDNLLSTCSLLEEIHVSSCMGLKTIKVKNLQYLRNLTILARLDNLEIDHVPNLSCFIYYSSPKTDFRPFTKVSLASVTKLLLQWVIIDNAFLDMIKLNFRLLQNLTLKLNAWSSECFDITCVSLHRLSLGFKSSPNLIKVQVFAPKLRFFNYDGKTMPSLVFPAITPEQIKVELDMDRPIDGLFFVKMREALMLSSNFVIRLKFDAAVPLNIDFDDLRRRVPFPATNLERLSVEAPSMEGLSLLFFDAFFSICHPKYVNAGSCVDENDYICKLMIKELMENNTRKGSWPHYLQDVQVKNPHHGNWETLTDSWKKLTRYWVEFKLNWCSS